MSDETAPPIEETLESFKKEQLAAKAQQEKKSWKNFDVFLMFYGIVFVTMVIMTATIISFAMFGFDIGINLEKFASALNIAIIFISGAEGFRGFASSASQPIGECTPVPAYKLKYLMSYEFAFLFLAAASYASQMYCYKLAQTMPNVTIPKFATDKFFDGLLSNFIGYLVARFGSKVATDVDLSSIPFFKRKIT